MSAKAAISENSMVADLIRVVPDPEELRHDSYCAVRENAYEVPHAALLPFRSAMPELEIHKAAAEGPTRSREQEVAVWILIVALLILSLAAGYALWAKVASAWPFSQ